MAISGPPEPRFFYGHDGDDTFGTQNKRIRRPIAMIVLTPQTASPCNSYL